MCEQSTMTFPAEFIDYTLSIFSLHIAAGPKLCELYYSNVFQEVNHISDRCHMHLYATKTHLNVCAITNAHVSILSVDKAGPLFSW